MGETKNLVQKILAVSERVGHVSKNGTNTHFKFSYQAWDDVLPAVRDACVEEGIAILPQIKSVDRGDRFVTITATFRITDFESEYICEFAGESLGNDDKAIQKAMTSATKYFFLKLFMIPVVGDADPDGDAPAPKQAPSATPTKKAPAINWKEESLKAFDGDEQKLEQWKQDCKDRGHKFLEALENAWAATGGKLTSDALYDAIKGVKE